MTIDNPKLPNIVNNSTGYYFYTYGVNATVVWFNYTITANNTTYSNGVSLGSITDVVRITNGYAMLDFTGGPSGYQTSFYY